MAAFLLNNPSAVISIPDELEAFLHVIIFYVIRFLPHNCRNVGKFMNNYFDGFEPGIGQGEYYCGMHKQTAMHSGKITLAGGANLIIYRAALGRANMHSHAFLMENRHPIALVLDALLDLCKARYTLLANPERPAEHDSTPESSTPQDDIADAWAMEHWTQEEETADEKEVVISGKEWDVLEEKALKLEDHDKVVKMLARFISNPKLRWPAEDKIGDQLNPNFHPKKELVATTAAAPAPTTASQSARTRSLTLMNRSLGMPPPTTASGSSSKPASSLVDEGEAHDSDADDAPPTKRIRSNGGKPPRPRAAPKRGKGKGKGRSRA